MTHPDPQNHAMGQFHNHLRFAAWVSDRFFDDWRRVQSEALANAIGWASR